MSTGYQADFIDNETVPLPKPGDHVRGDALNEGEPLDYSRFSILFSKTRHFAIYTAPSY